MMTGKTLHQRIFDSEQEDEEETVTTSYVRVLNRQQREVAGSSVVCRKDAVLDQCVRLQRTAVALRAL